MAICHHPWVQGKASPDSKKEKTSSRKKIKIFDTDGIFNCNMKVWGSKLYMLCQQACQQWWNLLNHNHNYTVHIWPQELRLGVNIRNIQPTIFFSNSQFTFHFKFTSVYLPANVARLLSTYWWCIMDAVGQIVVKNSRWVDVEYVIWCMFQGSMYCTVGHLFAFDLKRNEETNIRTW